MYRNRNTNIRSARQVSGRMRMVEVTFAKWWRMWYDQVWESLLPLKKWKEEKTNLAVGDLVLLKYSSKYSTPQYRYAIVLRVHPDAHGVVRDVTIGVHSRHLKEPKGVYVPSPLEEMVVPVQRCTVLLAKADQHSLEPADPDLHMCEAELRFPDPLANPVDSPSVPIGPENSPSPGPTAEIVSSDLNETQPLPVDPHQARLLMFGVTAIHHLGAQRPDVSCWECITRQQIRDCENPTVTPM